MRFSPIRHSTVKAFVLKCYKCRKSRVVVYVPNWAAGTRENLPQSPESLSTGGREEKIPHRANWGHLGWELWPQRTSWKYSGLGFLLSWIRLIPQILPLLSRNPKCMKATEIRCIKICRWSPGSLEGWMRQTKVQAHAVMGFCFEACQRYWPFGPQLCSIPSTVIHTLVQLCFYFLNWEAKCVIELQQDICVDWWLQNILSPNYLTSHLEIITFYTHFGHDMTFSPCVNDIVQGRRTVKSM